MMDARKTFVVGVSIILGLSINMLPGVYLNLPGMLQPAFASSLSVATLLSALLLNLLFRIGVAQRAKLQIDPRADSSEQIFLFMEKQGGAWGARREVIDRAKSAMNECVEAVSLLEPSISRIDAEVSFDEFSLDIDMRYDGELMKLPFRGLRTRTCLEDERAVARLAGFLIAQGTMLTGSSPTESTVALVFSFILSIETPRYADSNRPATKISAAIRSRLGKNRQPSME